MRDALSAAADGATLRLAAGDHVGPFFINRSVKLISDAPELPAILRGSGEGALVRVQGRGIDVGFFGLTFADGGDTRAGGCIWVPNGARVVAQNCVFQRGVAMQVGGGGIAIRRGELIVRDCRFIACRGRTGAAVWIGEKAQGELHNCTAQACVSEHGDDFAHEPRPGGATG